jgi:predicted transcriptional regulator
MKTTSVRIDAVTHERLKRLAELRGVSLGRIVALAVHSFTQEVIGKELSSPLTQRETAWLDAWE